MQVNALSLAHGILSQRVYVILPFYGKLLHSQRI